MISRSLHVIASLIEILFPGWGFVVSIHPLRGIPAKSAMISNLHDHDVIAIAKEYIEKVGVIHDHEHQSLKN